MIRYKIAWAVMFVLGLIWVMWPVDTQQPSGIKLFCTHGRVFIQFDEKYNSWGTMWLDDDGRPMPCDGDEVKDKKTTTRVTI